jgi:hypothetical protein
MVRDVSPLRRPWCSSQCLDCYGAATDVKFGVCFIVVQERHSGTRVVVRGKGAKTASAKRARDPSPAHVEDAEPELAVAPPPSAADDQLLEGRRCASVAPVTMKRGRSVRYVKASTSSKTLGDLTSAAAAHPCAADSTGAASPSVDADVVVVEQHERPVSSAPIAQHGRKKLVTVLSRLMNGRSGRDVTEHPGRLPSPGDRVSLVREPDNVYDSGAVRVRNQTGDSVGMLEGSVCGSISALLLRGVAVDAIFMPGRNAHFPSQIVMTYSTCSS